MLKVAGTAGANGTVAKAERSYYWGTQDEVGPGVRSRCRRSRGWILKGRGSHFKELGFFWRIKRR